MSLRNVILGYLEEPASGYDIKQTMDDSLSHVWAAEASQIYGALRAMEKEGLLESSAEKSNRGPERRVYRRTPKGEAEFSSWLESDPKLSQERLAILAQIHFLGRSRNPGKTTALLARVRARFVERLQQYESAHAAQAERKGEKVDALFDTLALDLYVKTLRARVEWCDEAIQRLAALGGKAGPAGA